MLQNTWPVTLKNVQVIKKKERLRNCHRPEETKETRCLKVLIIWYPRKDPRAERELGKKNSEI